MTGFFIGLTVGAGFGIFAAALLRVASDNDCEQDDVEQTCRICGCTRDHACPGGCYWVETDLCSACAEKGEDE